MVSSNLEASYPGPHEVAADDGAGGAQQVHHARPGEVKIVPGLYTQRSVNKIQRQRSPLAFLLTAANLCEPAAAIPSPVGHWGVHPACDDDGVPGGVLSK